MSLDDALIGIQQELNRVNQAANDRRWPTVLAGLDRIVEFANEGFEEAGKFDAPATA